MLRSTTLKNITFTREHWGLYLLTIIHLSMNSLIKMTPLQFIKKNVQNLALEIYKYLHDASPAILSEVFKVNKTITYDLYDLMHNELYVRNPKIVSRVPLGSRFSGFCRVLLGSQFSSFCRVPLGSQFSSFCMVPLGSWVPVF